MRSLLYHSNYQEGEAIELDLKLLEAVAGGAEGGGGMGDPDNDDGGTGSPPGGPGSTTVSYRDIYGNSGSYTD